jgi:hypothetical protein
MYNEELLLPMWIKSWLDIPFINKIYLVDGGSTDKSVEIARSYDRVHVSMVRWKNDFARQRNMALRLSKSDVKWVFQPDIDEMPCGNISDIQLEELSHVNQYIIPYLKFYDWNKLWFFKNNHPTLYENTMVQLAANKSTTTIFSKRHLKGYMKSLHEMPMLSGEVRRKVVGSPLIGLSKLKNYFFMGHFDQAKHFEQARQNGTTVEYEMGLKRVRYRFISPATYDGVTYDQTWAYEAVKPGNEAMIEELGRAQLKSFMDEHFLLPDYDATGLLNEHIKSR